MTQNPTPIAYVCFRHAKPPVGDIGQAVRRALGLPPDPASSEPDRPDSFSTDAGLVSLLDMPFPYPASDLTDDLGQSAAWPDWRTGIATWKSHMIVTVLGSDTEFEMRKRKVASLLGIYIKLAATGGLLQSLEKPIGLRQSLGDDVMNLV